MTFYEKYVLPYLLNCVMQDPRMTAERARLVPRASGRVLEIGMGSGLNLRFYGGAVETVTGIDPSGKLSKMAARRATAVPFAVDFLPLSAEVIPLDDHSIDTVVSTWTLCTIPDVVSALKEMRRVLKPEGRLMFIEHGRSPDPGVYAWQNRLNRPWNSFAGGCNLNREIDSLLDAGGFDIDEMETGYMPNGPKFLSFLYRGLARPR